MSQAVGTSSVDMAKTLALRFQGSASQRRGYRAAISTLLLIPKYHERRFPASKSQEQNGGGLTEDLVRHGAEADATWHIGDLDCL